MPSITKQERLQLFIQKSRNLHGLKYDYRNVVYLGAHTHVLILCKHHGIFSQTPVRHLSSSGCPECGKRIKAQSKIESSAKAFVSKSRLQHGLKYDYSKVVYKHGTSSVSIKCPTHGIFKQLPSVHLRGHGCPACSIEKNTMHCTSNTQDFIKSARQVHGLRYSYTRVEYINNRTKIAIICKRHGIFYQTPNNHLTGQNCPECADARFNVKDPAVLYVLLITNDAHTFIGYGISNSLRVRLNSHSSVLAPFGYRIVQRKIYKFTTGANAYQMENMIKAKTAWREPTRLPGFKTEAVGLKHGEALFRFIRYHSTRLFT